MAKFRYFSYIRNCQKRPKLANFWLYQNSQLLLLKKELDSSGLSNFGPNLKVNFFQLKLVRSTPKYSWGLLNFIPTQTAKNLHLAKMEDFWTFSTTPDLSKNSNFGPNLEIKFFHSNLTGPSPYYSCWLHNFIAIEKAKWLQRL